MREKTQELQANKEEKIANYSRRNFLMMTGLVAGSGLLLEACNDRSSMVKPDDPDLVNLGSGDIGILNYAYALEQLEAAFYTQVAMNPYANISSSELALLSDIRDHEIAHREFFKKALGDKAIRDLEVDFSKIDFNNRNSVLQAAKTFEDLGVSAYNGAGKLITTPDYLVIAGKIVSVEARHAAYIRDLLSNGSFADNTVVDSNGLDKSRMPTEVLTAAAPFIKTRITGQDLPTA